jgi:biopolymer transport protein ExbB
VAGDTRSQLEASLISAQYPDRAEKLASLVKKKNIPSAAALNDLWYVLQHEITESGKVVKFEAAVTDPSGEARTRMVTRVGLFNAVSDGKYLTWISEVGKLNELARQPSSRYLATISDLEESEGGMVRFAIDPSRGSILSLLVQTPSLGERIQFGGVIGYMILALGALAFLGALIRILYLSKVTLRVQAQKQAPKASLDNPLGRVMHVFEQNPKVDTDTLSLKLDEAILREQSNFDKFLWAIKVVSVAAPLMGLLGTVTGMIRTFQAITLFGTGDPKLMAGGISEALVTTMLGLVVAIPLVLLHSWLRTMSRRLSDVLGEQSAGIVARQAENTANV